MAASCFEWAVEIMILIVELIQHRYEYTSHTYPLFTHLDLLLSKVLGKGLEVSVLQKYVREEDIDAIRRFIGKDWYAFGRCMKVEENILDHIKEVETENPERKLMEFLISKKVCYKDVITFGDKSVDGILDYLLEGKGLLRPYSKLLL